MKTEELLKRKQQESLNAEVQEIVDERVAFYLEYMMNEYDKDKDSVPATITLAALTRLVVAFDIRLPSGLTEDQLSDIARDVYQGLDGSEFEHAELDNDFFEPGTHTISYIEE